MAEVLTIEWRAYYEKRATIIEEGRKMPRAQAETLAMEATLKAMEARGNSGDRK